MSKKLVIVLLFLLILSNTIYAEGDNFKFVEDLSEAGVQVPSDYIDVDRDNKTGDFKFLSYVIESTMSTSSTIYRTSEIKLNFGGYTITIDSNQLAEYRPTERAGETIYSMIYITFEHIAAELGLTSQSEKDILKAKLSDPKQIQVYANLEFVRKNPDGTETILGYADTSNANELDIAQQKWGFSNRSREDWESRNYNIDRLELMGREVPKTGLRPTGIRR